VASGVHRFEANAHNGGAIMTITAAALISTLASQASSSTNRQSVAAPAAPQRPSLADTATISQASQAALAAATSGTSPPPAAGADSGLGTEIGTSGTTYDFGNMTNAQAIAAAKTLGSEGKISPDAEAQITMTASGWNTICINPTTHAVDPAAQAAWIAGHLSDPTPSNLEDTFKGYIAYDNSTHNTKAAALNTEVLQDMEKYSSDAGSATVTSAAAGGIISATA
jgi:hypothetical protein